MTETFFNNVCNGAGEKKIAIPADVLLAVRCQSQHTDWTYCRRDERWVPEQRPWRAVRCQFQHTDLPYCRRDKQSVPEQWPWRAACCTGPRPLPGRNRCWWPPLAEKEEGKTVSCWGAHHFNYVIIIWRNPSFIYVATSTYNCLSSSSLLSSFLPDLSVFCVSLFMFPDEDILLSKLSNVFCLSVRRRSLLSNFISSFP